MERDRPETAGSGSDTRIPQRTSRITSPLVITSASQRRSLFSRPRPKEDPARPASPRALSDPRAASPSGTKIPRPASRRQFTLSDAYRLAEEEEAAQGSPSPAPRSWRSRRESNDKRSPKIGTLNRTSLDSGPAPPRDELQSRQSDTSDSTFEEKLRQYAQDQPNPEEAARRSNGLFSRSRIGSRIVETGKELVRKTSRGSLDGSPRAAKTTGSSTWRRLSGRKRESSNASSTHDLVDPEQADHGPANQALRPDATPANLATPNKSFAWQADADFTGGDLQISSSPPVRRSDTRIEGSLEAGAHKTLAELPQPRQRNTRIEEIRALEIETALRFPDEPEEPVDDHLNDAQRAKANGEDAPTRNRSVSRTRSMMDELRTREIESLSRRALATSRLDEIRSRSPSPDIARKPNSESFQALSPPGNRPHRRVAEGLASLAHSRGVTSQNTHVQTSSAEDQDQAQAQANGVGANGDQDPREKLGATRSVSRTSDEPRDLLRRLAATGSSPISEPRVDGDSKGLAARDSNRDDDGGSAAVNRPKRFSRGAKGDARPTVGFAGLPRNMSVESNLAKRASLANSESDPIERIEGEMKLFAPLDNQSERGSLRAPSPEPDEEAAPEETPRTAKPDPLTQPTPRVTGAYVETPATVKAEKLEDGSAALAVETGDDKPQKEGSEERLGEGTGSMDSKLSSRGRRDSIGARQPRQSQSAGRDKLPGRSSSLSIRRRAKSLSRSRAPLINSVKPPTVKDDLREIHRINQIDDSTLEDFAELLGQKDGADLILGSREPKPEDDNDERLDRKQELEAYGRMSRSLQTSLEGIRTAKQGLTRLEGKVSHAETTAKNHVHAAVHEEKNHHNNKTSAADPQQPCPVCQGHHHHATTHHPTGTGTGGTYIRLPVPRLWSWQQHPRGGGFRFTLPGLALFLLTLWYVAESAMCFAYCKPQYCYPGVSCDWDPDDPAWGYALPVQLDRWATGGRGRELARRFEPDVADWLADLWDAARGVDDLAAVDTSGYSWEQKRQHRRRLAKKKKGLAGERFVGGETTPEDEALFGAWRDARLARELGEFDDAGEDESIAADERI